MSKCTPQVFNGITAPMWARIAKEASAYGLPVSGDAGQGTKDGFEVSWSFTLESGRLELQCHESPFWAPCTMIHQKIQEIVESCR
jgi:hypothetical protein